MANNSNPEQKVFCPICKFYQVDCFVEPEEYELPCEHFRDDRCSCGYEDGDTVCPIHN